MMPKAVFVLGGSASGKSATVQSEFVGTAGVENTNALIEPAAGFTRERWFDSDRIKRMTPLYTDEAGDEESRRRFGRDGLGGPSGPRTLYEYGKYPDSARKELERFLQDRAGFGSVEEFISAWFDDEDDHDPNDIGGGLTHELSKYLAQALLEDALAEEHPQQSVVWDACGRAENYIYWIQMALEHGYEVEVVYVYCPLDVALDRAGKRQRRLDPAIVRDTHRRAAEAARALEVAAADLASEGYPVRYRVVETASRAEQALTEQER